MAWYFQIGGGLSLRGAVRGQPRSHVQLVKRTHFVCYKRTTFLTSVRETNLNHHTRIIHRRILY